MWSDTKTAMLRMSASAKLPIIAIQIFGARSLVVLLARCEFEQPTENHHHPGSFAVRWKFPSFFNTTPGAASAAEGR
jgi:hypothetical protein